MGRAAEMDDAQIAERIFGLALLVRSVAGIVKLRPTADFDAQHGGFTVGTSPVSWGSIDERFASLTIPPSHHPGDKRLLGQAGDGVDPRGAVAAVPTAQVGREFGHAHVGMGAWMGQNFGGVHACLTTAGVARRDEHPRAVGVVTQPHPSESPLGLEYARRRSWPPRSRRALRTGRSR